jgi:aminomuconate-semialdehyde/2-hydroxymuconate-6-semialdehyde dehydrogenase
MTSLLMQLLKVTVFEFPLINQEVKKLRQGPTCTNKSLDHLSTDDVYDSGAMTMPGEVEKLEKMIQAAVKMGAKVAIGGKRNPELKGQFFLPTVITNATHEMEIVTQEAFGPVMVVIPFETDEEVVEYCNSASYGLGSYVFSKDYKRAHEIAKKIVAGVVSFLYKQRH